MRFAKHLLLLSALAALYACHAPAPSPYAAETAAFSAYLREHFHRPIDRDSTYYLLLSRNACIECMQSAILRFLGTGRSICILDEEVCDTYQPLLQRNQRTNALLIDSTGFINRLPYHGGNIGIIAVHNGAIDTIIQGNVELIGEQLKVVR